MNFDTLAARYAISLQPLAGAVPAAVAEVDSQTWARVAQAVQAGGGRLISIWGAEDGAGETPYTVSAAYCLQEGLIWLRLALREGERYPDLAPLFPGANRLQRALSDLLGVSAAGAADDRPWVNHGLWPKHYFPLRRRHSGREQYFRDPEPYRFVQVEGDGVHEIAVGPIHAGIIEPGHFRFSVVGEKVLRLEQRLGYVHKAVEKLFSQMRVADGYRLAGRVSGDSTVAFAWAYCMAAESAAGCTPPARAGWLRALMLERERVANHLGDLGALGNDAGLAVGLAQFMLLKEKWLRLNDRLFGHRFMMDRIVPGGVACDIDRAGLDAVLAQCKEIEADVRALRAIYDEHAGLQDRFIGTGRVTPALAAQLGLYGLAGRASGQPGDARVDQPAAPYAALAVQSANHRAGDVAARVALRFEEIFESFRLLREIAGQIPAGLIQAEFPATCGNGFGIGWVEGWRGPAFVALHAEPDGRIASCRPHDPSWQNWPLLQHAIMGNIVPDFPLINKSFNLSYSGQDL